MHGRSAWRSVPPIITKGLQTGRPTFSQCVKVVRACGGDKRTFTEERTPNALVFQFKHNQDFDAAHLALNRINAVFAEQFTAEERYRRISISRRCCVHCKATFADHVNGACLFMSTRYLERTDEP